MAATGEEFVSPQRAVAGRQKPLNYVFVVHFERKLDFSCSDTVCVTHSLLLLFESILKVKTSPGLSAEHPGLVSSFVTTARELVHPSVF